MTPEDLEQKFRTLARSVLTPEQVSRLWQLTFELDTHRDIGELFSLLAGV